MITFQWRGDRRTLFDEIAKAFKGYGQLKAKMDSMLETLQAHPWSTVERMPNYFGGTDGYGNHKIKLHGKVQIRILWMQTGEEATLLIAGQELNFVLEPQSIWFDGGERRKLVESPGGMTKHREEAEEYP